MSNNSEDTLKSNDPILGSEQTTLESIRWAVKHKRKSFCTALFERCPETKELLKIGHTKDDVYFLLKHEMKLEPQYCQICGKNLVHLDSVNSKFLKTCSKECTKKLREQTCLEKYGVSNAGGSKQAIEKARQTNLQRYGVEWVGQVEETKKKIAKTNLERYGYESTFSSPKIKSKAKQTSLEKYGTEWAMSSKEIRNLSSKRKMDESYKRLFNFSETVKPAFTREEWNGCGTNKKYQWKCLECGETFTAYVNGPGHLPVCRKCHPYSVSSGQEELIHFIENNYHGKILINDRIILSGKEIDVYLPELKLGFEFNGNFWHSINYGKITSDYHVAKTELAESNGIHLIQIFEYEWFSKQEIIKERIKNLITKHKPIGARKCLVKEIEHGISEDFLNKHHFQGSCNAKVNLGLFYEDQLVGVMTFGKPRFNKNYQWELLRFTTSETVVGGAGKLLAYFESVYKPESIISYADRRWSSKLSNVYEKIGFACKGSSDPNYVYFKPGILLPRYKAQKHKLKAILGNKFNPELSETENMLSNNFLKIFDCGNLVFEKRYKK